MCAVRHQLVCSVIKKGTDNIVYVTSKEAVNKGCHPPGNQWKSPVTIQDSDTRKVLPFRGAYHREYRKGKKRAETRESLPSAVKAPLRSVVRA